MKDLYIQRARKFFLQEAICASLAFLLAIAVNYIFDIPHGYWIPMTVAVMFAMPSQGVIVQRSIDRMFGTIVGLLLSFFFLGILAYSDYRWTYLLPLIFFLMYYTFYLSNNYAIMAALMAMFVPILLAMTSEDIMPLVPTLMARLFNTGIGIIIALSCEYTIYRFASLSSRDTKHYTREYFKTIGEMISICNECFLGQKKFNKLIAADIRKMMSAVTSIETLYINIRHELDFSESKEAILNRFFYDCNKIAKSIRKMLAIIIHDHFDETVISKEAFIDTGNMISSKYLDVVRYIYEKHDDYILKMDSAIEFMNKQYTSPSYIYVSELQKLNSIFDDFVEYVHETRHSASKLNQKNIY